MSQRSEETSETPSNLHGALAPLNIPDYRRLLASNALWWQFMWMEIIVAGWLVLELTDSAWQVSLIGFYRMAPLLLVGFVSGPLTDRFGRRKIIIVSQIVNLVVSLLIAVIILADRLAVWHLAVGALVLGTTWAVDWTARRSLLPDLVGRARTMDAMLLEGISQNITRVAGPISSGVLYATLGPFGCFLILTAMALASLLILVRLSRRPVLEGTPTDASYWTRTVEGLRYIRRNPAILGVTLITVAMNFLVFPYQALLPVFARDILNQGPVGFGVLASANGVGAFAGLWMVSRLRRHVGISWLYAGGSFLMAAAVAAFSTSTGFYLSLGLLTLSGIGHAAFGLLQSTIVLLSARDDMRSRAMGGIVLAIGTGPPGRLSTGAVAERFGAPFAVFGTCAIASLFVVAVTLAMSGFRNASAAREANA